MAGEGLSIVVCLGEIRTRLTGAAAVARAAVVCAEAGSEEDAVRIALDLDESLHEIKTLHGALLLMGRMRRRDATGSC